MVVLYESGHHMHCHQRFCDVSLSSTLLEAAPFWSFGTGSWVIGRESKRDRIGVESVQSSIVMYQSLAKCPCPETSARDLG